MKYNPDKHHRRSIRLKNYDYTQPGAYFVTICVQDMECLFGKIINGEMILNNAGQIVKHEWNKTNEIRDNIKLDQFVIMPNHFHGIIVILTPIGSRRRRDPMGVGPNAVPVGRAHAPVGDRTEQFGKPVSGSIPTVVRSFKSAVTKQINIMRGITGARVWQRGYYLHIIQNEKSLNNIRKYIINNPLKWELDKYNPTIGSRRRRDPMVGSKNISMETQLI